MDRVEASKKMHGLWSDLLVSYGLIAKDSDPFNPETRIALAYDNGVICFRYSPRHYFLGVDFEMNSAFWYVLVPEVERLTAPEKSQEICQRLEAILNSERDLEFESFFTLPAKVSYSQRDFADKTYKGFLARTASKGDLFEDIEKSQMALKSWRKKIFVPTCKFLDDALALPR